MREVESKTSAEIVPVAATASGRYDRPEDIVGLWGSVLFLTIAWFWLQPLEGGLSDWGFVSPSYGLPFLLLAVLLGFLVGVYAGTHVMVVRHFFTPAGKCARRLQLGRARCFSINEFITLKEHREY